MKKLILLLCILVTQAFGENMQTQEGLTSKCGFFIAKNNLEVPGCWEIDIFKFLAKNYPSITSKKVYYTKIEYNLAFKDQKRLEKDKLEGEPIIAKSIGVRRQSKTENIIPQTQRAIPGDIVTINYNQKLEIFISELDQIAVLAPSEKSVLVVPRTLEQKELDRLHLSSSQERELNYKPSKKAKGSPATEPDNDNDGKTGEAGTKS